MQAQEKSIKIQIEDISYGVERVDISHTPFISCCTQPTNHNAMEIPPWKRKQKQQRNVSVSRLSESIGVLQQEDL